MEVFLTNNKGCGEKDGLNGKKRSEEKETPI